MEKVSSVAVSGTCDVFSFRLNFSIIMFRSNKSRPGVFNYVRDRTFRRGAEMESVKYRLSILGVWEFGRGGEGCSEGTNSCCVC